MSCDRAGTQAGGTAATTTPTRVTQLEDQARRVNDADECTRLCPMLLTLGDSEGG